MSTAWRLIVRTPGGPEVIEREDIAVPAPGPGEVTLAQHAVGVNFIDTYYRSGLYPVPLPSGLGGEGAGEVIAVGEAVEGFAAGDRVAYCGGPPGAYATHRALPAKLLVKLPPTLSYEDAAAILLKGVTAEVLIERCARIKPGQAVLVHAAAGGVGSILVAWLAAIGARVIAHSGSAEKAAAAKALGADLSLHCPLEELADAVREATGGAGAAVVLDGVGKASWSASLAATARLGMLVSYGNASGAVPPVAPLELMRAGSIFLTRPSMFDYVAEKGALQASADRLFAMIADGKVQVRIGQRFALADAAEAHRALEARKTQGSTVLTL